MNNKILFFTGCLPIRLLLTFLAYISLRHDYSSLKCILISITFIIGIGFWIIYMKGWRKKGFETLGQPLWWNHLRPLYGTMYLLFSVFALFGSKNAWMILMLDIMIGIIAQLNQMRVISMP